jgi:uncharacterized protein with GYD domain
MPTYIVLMNLTEQGAKDIKNAPERVQTAVDALENAGGKLVGFYLTMGEYDYVSVVEVPSDEVALLQLFGLAMGGNVNTTTLKAFTLEEFGEIVKQLP